MKEIRYKGMKRNPKVIHLPVTFEAMPDHVVAIISLDGGSTIGLRFNSPEQMLIFFTEMMEKAVIVWPDNEWIREYLEE